MGRVTSTIHLLLVILIKSSERLFDRLRTSSDDYRPQRKTASNFSRVRWRWSLKPKRDVLDSVRMQQNDWLVTYVIYVPPSRMPWMTTKKKKKTRNISHVRAGIVDASSLSIINDCSVNYPINNNNIITLFWFQNWIPLKLLPLVFRWVWVDGTSSSFSTRT